MDDAELYGGAAPGQPQLERSKPRRKGLLTAKRVKVAVAAAIGLILLAKFSRSESAKNVAKLFNTLTGLAVTAAKYWYLFPLALLVTPFLAPGAKWVVSKVRERISEANVTSEKAKEYVVHEALEQKALDMAAEAKEAGDAVKEEAAREIARDARADADKAEEEADADERQEIERAKDAAGRR